VRELAARGHHVKALLRAGSDLRGLQGADYEAVAGDLSRRDLLEKAMRGCDWCFHVAASYHLWLRDYAPAYRCLPSIPADYIQKPISLLKKCAKPLIFV